MNTESRQLKKGLRYFKIGCWEYRGEIKIVWGRELNSWGEGNAAKRWERCEVDSNAKYGWLFKLLVY